MPKTKPLPLSGKEFEVRYLKYGQLCELREAGLFGADSHDQHEGARAKLFESALSPADLAAVRELEMPDALFLSREVIRLNYSDPDAEGNS